MTNESTENTQPTQKLFPWREGLPTGPEVSILKQSYPDPQVGDRIPYAEVAAIIGRAPNTHRFRSVTNAWRRYLIDQGKVIHCETGVAFVVATCEQITDRTASVFRHVSHVTRSQRRDLSIAKVETETQKQLVEHQARLLLAVERDARKSRMNLIPSVSQPAPIAQIQPPVSQTG